MDDPQACCDGCTTCSMRCTDGIRIAEGEYYRIVETLRALDPQHAHRILRQKKELPWFEDITYRACLFLDIDTHLCLVYEARPLVCRLFGRVRHLPCPIERAPQDWHAEHLLRHYTAQPLKTFQQWMATERYFNFDDLLGVPEQFPSYDL